MAGPVTFDEMRERGVSEDVQTFMLKLVGRLDRNPHLGPFEGFNERMHAFGIGPSCQCGERGLAPHEDRCHECDENDD